MRYNARGSATKAGGFSWGLGGEDLAALGAGSKLDVSLNSVRRFLHGVCRVIKSHRRFVELAVASLAEPDKQILLLWTPLSLDNEGP